MMNFAVIGVNDKSCPFKVRERITFTHSKVIENLHALKRQGIEELVILCTCNRSEIYIKDINIEEAIRKVVTFYESYYRKNKTPIITEETKERAQLLSYLQIYRDEAAIRHLFEVSIGLDSIVLGEDQILGQVKRAYYMALQEGASGKVTNKIFLEAISLAKKVKHMTKMSEHSLSISHIAIQFLKQRQGTLRGKKALIIGLGQMNELAIKYLLEEQLEAIYVTNRTRERTYDVSVHYHQLIPINYERRYEFLNEVDIVISATAAPHAVLHYEEMPMLKRPIDMMDIAVPRDIEERIGDLPLVNLYDIEDLKQIAKENEAIRESLAQQADVEIEKSMKKLIGWIEHLDVQEVMQHLERYCNQVKSHTAKYLNRKLGRDIEPEILEFIMSETLKRCLRRPIAKLMTTEEEEKIEIYRQVIGELFEQE